jgi:hypothetical protein
MFGKLSSIALIVTLFLVTFLGVNTLHFQFFTVRVVLYDALLDVVIAGIFAFTACFVLLARRFATTREEMALSLIIGLLLTTLYSLSVPAIIDRSLSVYILEKLAQRGGNIRRDAFEDILKQEFFPEHQLVDIRLTEQLNSGTVTIENGCVRLTRRGIMIADFTRFYRTKLLPKKREIMGKFSDDLTDPFRNSTQTVDYACHPSKP